jgi:hypothetical protein
MKRSDDTIIKVPLSEAFPEDTDTLSTISPRINCWSFMEMHRNNYKFLPDLHPSDKPLPGKSMNRYCFYTDIGKARFNSSTFKTQEDLDREAKEAILAQPVPVEVKGNLKWDPVESLQYLKEKAQASKKEINRQRKLIKKANKVKRIIHSKSVTDKPSDPVFDSERDKMYHDMMIKAGWKCTGEAPWAKVKLNKQY